MITPTGSAVSTPPSRHDNPFATCWTRPGALAFRFGQDGSAEGLVAKLASEDWRGAIVGPHGSGKSTLLQALKPVLVQAKCRFRSIALRDTARLLPTAECIPWTRAGCRSQPVAPIAPMRNSPQAPRQALVIIDGFEALGWLARAWLIRRCRRARVGLLVTSHAPTRLPTLIQLAPDRRLVEQLVAELCAKVSSDITPGDVTACHASHGSNVREILFALYDRHEMRRRQA